MKARKPRPTSSTPETAALKAEAAEVAALLAFAESRLRRLFDRAGVVTERQAVDGYTIATWIQGCAENALMGVTEANRYMQGLGTLTTARLRQEITGEAERARVVA